MTRTVLNLLFPLLTFPYICRILGPENQGKVTYITSIIAIFTMLAQLGIPTYGLRECSKKNNNKQSILQFITEVSLLQFITASVCTLAFFGYFYFFEKKDFILFAIFSPQIFLNTFVYDYYYTATENQEFITKRFVIIRIVEVIALFLFVKGKKALYIYSGLLTIGLLLNLIANIFGLRELFKYKLNKLEIKKHLKPIVVIFLATVSVTLYCNFDNIMVGKMVDKESVGYYGVANRLVRIIITIAVATSSVIFPRLQQALQNKDWDSYGKYSRDYICYTLIFAIPATVGLVVLSKGIILITAGDKFIPAIFSLQLLSPILIIVPIANFFGGMILIVNNKELYYTLSVTIAAAINILANYFLISLFKQNGAIIGTLIAEFVGLCLEIYFSRKDIRGIKICLRNILHYIIAAFVMGFLLTFFKNIYSINNIIIETIIFFAMGVLIYCLILYFFKDKYFMYIFMSFFQRVKKCQK